MSDYRIVNKLSSIEFNINLWCMILIVNLMQKESQVDAEGGVIYLSHVVVTVVRLAVMYRVTT